MTAIITLPLVPLRASDNERSEMTSQLLFGERLEILEVRERWLQVRNLSDNYVGWSDRKMIQILPADEDLTLSPLPSYRVIVPLTVCDKTTSNETMFLPGGSLFPLTNGNECVIGNETFRIRNFQDITTVEMVGDTLNGDTLIRLASQYLYAPYLWGGKSLLGIDCSGLVQVVFSMCGFQLPRDASEQVDCGKVIDFLSEAQAGDIAFFENADGKIIHVGMLLDSHTIIHASGWVKIETIDSQGIISAKTGEYTHKLRVIKRLI